MAPVIRALAGEGESVASRVVVTAQHREMLDQALQLFDIAPDYDLNVMVDNQTPTQVASAILARLEPILQAERPDWVLVQGDTTTTMAAAIAAFYGSVKVAHVEAGLRTHDKFQPFPEEINRVLTTALADLHFAPTPMSKRNLLREGVGPEKVFVTGNTVIDALRWSINQPLEDALLRDVLPADPSVRVILITAHRRENFGRGIENICTAVAKICQRYGDGIRVIYPVHPNPMVEGVVRRMLGDVPQVRLLAPLGYGLLTHVMKRAHLVLTDSGGLQEEAPALGKPVLVLRSVTERPEAVEAGTVRVVGTEIESILRSFVELYDNDDAYAAMAKATNPYGDGRAAERIVRALLGHKVEEFGGFNSTA